MTRIIWKENDIVRLKLRDDLFTVGQMLISPFMRFYKISKPVDEWQDLDLNKEEELFTVLITNHVFRGLATGKAKGKSIHPSQKPMQRQWIDVHSNDGPWYEGKSVFLGGKLVELAPRTMALNEPTSNENKLQSDTYIAPVLIKNLTLPQHRKVLEELELTNQWSADSLCERLVRYFDKGIDRDDLKFQVFPGLYDYKEKLRPLTSRVAIPFR